MQFPEVFARAWHLIASPASLEPVERSVQNCWHPLREFHRQIHCHGTARFSHGSALALCALGQLHPLRRNVWPLGHMASYAWQHDFDDDICEDAYDGRLIMKLGVGF